MWLCLNNAFLSIVNFPKSTTLLLVRARVEGHIENVFPEAKVERTPGRDYLYRAVIPRAEVAAAMATAALSINYGNFKDSVKDEELHTRYSRVWREMSALQYVLPYGKDSAVAQRREVARKKRQLKEAAELQRRHQLRLDGLRRCNEMLFDTTGAR